jgi:hypothetical protein
MPVAGTFNILKQVLLSVVVLHLLLLVFPAWAQQYGQIANPQYLPGDWGLPENVINSDQVPSIKINPKASADRPLPVYKIASDTYMFLGSISILDKDNRGFNGKFLWRRSVCQHRWCDSHCAQGHSSVQPVRDAG